MSDQIYFEAEGYASQAVWGVPMWGVPHGDTIIVLHQNEEGDQWGAVVKPSPHPLGTILDVVVVLTNGNGRCHVIDLRGNAACDDLWADTADSIEGLLHKGYTEVQILDPKVQLATIEHLVDKAKALGEYEMSPDYERAEEIIWEPQV